MRDAIVFSSWAWEMFNVPERVALALAMGGSNVLYCEMPASSFKKAGTNLSQISERIHGFRPHYWGGKLNYFAPARAAQWRMVARQILEQAHAIGLKDPLFLYSHVEHLLPLCKEMKMQGLPLIHLCVDYPEPYQYELIAVSDQTLVIPKSVFHKLRGKFGEKIRWIPQSIHLPATRNGRPKAEPPMIAGVPHPRLGYLGPIYARLNLPLLNEVLADHPEWQFIHFGGAELLRLPNSHCAGWVSQAEVPAYVASFDVGLMPYDCFEEKNLHCSPLKLLDYFWAGLPVASTPVLSLSEHSDLIYFGETPQELSRAVECALAEPLESPKRAARQTVACAHSTQELARQLVEIL